ncbi:MAG: FMN-binding protein [Clostridiales bacterium]|jgi:electron transport complex protein RnfG|nr:FMN-binding protein [Clostridiales bacterium]
MKLSVFKPAVMLFVVTLVSGLLLGVANAVTAPQAAEQERLTLMRDLDEIFPGAQFNELPSEDNNIVKCYEALDANANVIGYVLETAPNGYGGPVQVLTGINMDQTVARIVVGTHSETPGLGANAANASFTDQYIGKSGTLNVIKQGTPGQSDIAAITSATITSTAVTTGVNTSLEYFTTTLKGGAN